MKGASNVPNGITVSLEKLKKVQLSKDKKSVLIQPGNNWGQVYSVLNKQDVTVTGGRVSVVGTGGLTLGGKSICSKYAPCYKLTDTNFRWHFVLCQLVRLGLRQCHFV
jgi:hypothetical protein